MSILAAIDGVPRPHAVNQAIEKQYNLNLENYLWKLPDRLPQYRLLTVMLYNMVKFNPEERHCSMDRQGLYITDADRARMARLAHRARR